MSAEPASWFIQSLNELFNKPDIHIVDKIFAPSLIAHVPMMPILTRSGFKNFIGSFYTAFPDFNMEIDDTITIPNRIVLRVTYFGKHDGDFLGIRATGHEVVVSSVHIFRTQNDLIVENWAEIDIFGLLGQLGSGNGYSASKN
jgi:predicted ester cyclase